LKRRCRTIVWLAYCGAGALSCNQILGIEQPTDRIDGGGPGGSTGGAMGAGGSAGTGGSTGTGGSSGTGGGTGTGGRAGTGGSTGTGGGTGTGGRAGTGGSTGTGGSAGTLCRDRQASDSTGIYVSTSGTDGASCGDRVQPCRLIQTGINRADMLGRSVVYVNAGTYDERLTLAAGIRVEGGWGAVGQVWSPICTATASEAVTVQPSSGNTTVFADALGGTASLAWLSIKSKQAASAPGESLYGVFARGTTTRLDLEQVRITVGPGGNGSSGARGADGIPGTGMCTPAGDGLKGSDGALGGGAVPGTFDMNGYVPGDATVGPTGGVGHNGVAMEGASSCVGCWAVCQIRQGTADQCESSVGPDSCGMNDGSPGCGGPGGRGGQGGRGGGSSIALFVWGATVNVIGGSLAGGNGGLGAAGGAGGNGGPGAAGVEGTKGPLCLSGQCIYQVTGGSSCSSLLRSVQGRGGVGGNGGPGGIGGQGGGGAGGSSFAVYKGGGGNVTVSAETALANGSAGTSMGNGAAGAARTIGP
jgi:hypothetical protein